jgi:hypothetical protein
MNKLAAMWAQAEHERIRKSLQHRELRKLCEELREANATVAPLIAEANARRRANMRTEGPQGFVMVHRE